MLFAPQLYVVCHCTVHCDQIALNLLALQHACFLTRARTFIKSGLILQGKSHYVLLQAGQKKYYIQFVKI